MNKHISTKIILSAIVIAVLLLGGVASSIIYSQFDATAKLESSVLTTKEKNKTIKKSSPKKTTSKKKF